MTPAVVRRRRTISALKVSRRLGGRQASWLRIAATVSAAVPHPAQVNGACDQGRIGAKCRHARHRADECVCRPVPAMPVAFQAHLLTGLDHLHQDPLEQQAHDGLTLSLVVVSACQIAGRSCAKLRITASSVSLGPCRRSRRKRS